MKKLAAKFLALVLFNGFSIASGIVSNSNHSASFIRMPARNASLALDAVYYNPAGLAFMEEGFHFSLNNQTIYQYRKIENEFPALNNGYFQGRVFSPYVPGIFAVFNREKFAISAAFIQVGGWGRATFKNGLPGLETAASAIPGMLTAMGINTTAYKVEMFFEGSSIGFEL